MNLKPFQLERFFAQYEFKAPYLMCCSDCESLSIQELLGLEPDAKEKFSKLWLGYTEAKGDPLLRREIAGLYQTVRPDEVLVHAGAEEAIFNFMNACLNPGDHIIVEYPCYQSLFEVARARGCEVTKWQLQQGEQGWGLDLAALKDSIQDNTRVIVINSPHNPTGHLISHRELEQIIDLARKQGIIIFCDEIYKYLEYNTDQRLPWACDLYENAVSLGVMSKSFGLPGLRIGWIATKNKNTYERLASFKDYTSICSSGPSEFLATVALRNKEDILNRNRAIIEANLALLDDFFACHQSLFIWNRPQAGPIAFPKLCSEEDVEQFCLDLVEKTGVLLLPGKYYDFGHNYFRVGFGRKNLPDCLTRLEEYLMRGNRKGMQP